MVDERVLVIGAGGHARVCIEALRDTGHTVVGAVSADGRGIDGLDTDVVGSTDDLDQIIDRLRVTAGFVAIGDNATRWGWMRRCADRQLPLVVAVSRFAHVSVTARVEPGALIAPGATVNAAAVVGTAAIINTQASVDHDCQIGEAAHIAPGSALGGAVRVADRGFVGLGCRVVPGVSIGADATVGAGAVVLDDVAAGDTVVGVPAHSVRRVR